jgi:hypothetical protein
MRRRRRQEAAGNPEAAEHHQAGLDEIGRLGLATGVQPLGDALRQRTADAHVDQARQGQQRNRQREYPPPAGAERVDHQRGRQQGDQLRPGPAQHVPQRAESHGPRCGLTEAGRDVRDHDARSKPARREQTDNNAGAATPRAAT